MLKISLKIQTEPIEMTENSYCLQPELLLLALIEFLWKFYLTIFVNLRRPQFHEILRGSPCRSFRCEIQTCHSWLQVKLSECIHFGREKWERNGDFIQFKLSSADVRGFFWDFKLLFDQVKFNLSLSLSFSFELAQLIQQYETREQKCRLMWTMFTGRV